MKKTFLLFIPLIFLFVGLATIDDYNVNWDEPEHFFRGQAYVRYILTGQKNYDTLRGPRRSIYQSDALNADYFLQHDYGHPPLNDIVAAATNIIFYQKLGWVGDVEAYHLFIILLSTVLVYLVGRWAAQEYGALAGIVASGSLALSPLLIAESHNNIKDPVESTFYALTIYWFYLAIKSKRWQNLIVFAMFAGFALGTKFNVIFLPFILLSWLVLISLPVVAKRKVPEIIKLPKAFWIVLLISPLIPLAIFYGSWPRLWGNLEPFIKTLNYYKDIGTEPASQAGYTFFTLNTYPIQWILYTTPPIVLFLVAVGIVGVFLRLRTNVYKPSALWLLWFLIPVIRVSLPGTSIYGGTRQIMEYLPAAALLSGLGAEQLGRVIGKKVSLALLLIALLPTVLKLYSIHPNENLYFNALIGGLPGAAAKNIPGWGTTLGNPYLAGVDWINKHAEKNAVVVITLGVMTNIPVIKLRPDITYANNLESLTDREGEYIMGLTYQAFPVPFYDAAYPERFLVPVYEVTVEGISILKIWKNDAEHTKPGFLNETDVPYTIIPAESREELIIEFDRPVFLTKLELSYDARECRGRHEGSVFTSRDGNAWFREPEGLFDTQIPKVTKNPSEGHITHFLAAVPATFVKLQTGAPCMLNHLRIGARALGDIFP